MIAHLKAAAALDEENTQGLVTPGTGLSPEEGEDFRRHQ